MSAATRKLFGDLMKEAAAFPDFNYRTYFIRRVQHGFKQGEEWRNEEQIEKSLAAGGISLAMLRRQAAVGRLYDPGVTLHHEQRE